MRTPRQPDVKTADVALANLAKFFRTADREEARRAWDVLTALRGPDEHNSRYKYATTAVIRAKFFSLGTTMNTERLLMNMVAKTGATVTGDHARRVQERDEVGLDTMPHFKYHAMAAFKALGLSWHSENKF